MTDPDKKPDVPTEGGSYVRPAEGAKLEKVEATVQLDDPEHPANAPAEKEAE